MSSLIPLGGEKDVESGEGSTKHSADDEDFEEDHESKNRRRSCWSCCCCCLLLLLLLGGVGAFFATGYTVPGFLKRNAEVDIADSTEPPPGNDSANLDVGTRDPLDGNTVPAPPGIDPNGNGIANPESPPPGEEPVEPTDETTTVTQSEPFRFGVITDAPFDQDAVNQLESSLAEADADQFILHVGNIRSSDNTLCGVEDYERAATALLTSPVPVWVLPGPSDWSTCENAEGSEDLYEEVFSSFTEDNWDVARPYTQPRRPYNFAFEASENVLIVGLNFLEADRRGTIDETFAWTRAVVDRFEGDKIVIASYSIPLEFMIRVDELAFPREVTYLRGTDGDITENSVVARATSRLTYATV